MRGCFRKRNCTRVVRGEIPLTPVSPRPRAEMPSPTRGEGAATSSAPSRARGHLVEKSRDAPDAAVLQHGKIRPLDRAVDAVGAEAPAEADMVAVAVGL